MIKWMGPPAARPISRQRDTTTTSKRQATSKLSCQWIWYPALEAGGDVDGNCPFRPFARLLVRQFKSHSAGS